MLIAFIRQSGVVLDKLDAHVLIKPKALKANIHNNAVNDFPQFN